MPRSKHPENVSPYTGLRVPVCKGTYMQEGGGLMLQGHTTAIVPCGNPTPKELPTGGGEWPTFRTARAQRTVRPLMAGTFSQSIPTIDPPFALTRACPNTVTHCFRSFLHLGTFFQLQLLSSDMLWAKTLLPSAVHLKERLTVSQSVT